MVDPLASDDPRQLGEFRLAGRLGEGGQGIVYLGHAPTGEPVAVKVLRFGTDPNARARLSRELGAVGTVASFCTARVLTASVDGPRPYVVSEFIDGPSLQQRVAAQGPLRGGELERLAVGTATALAAIHGAGVIHRDFKPANVLLGPDGPRVVDFGIARPAQVETITTGLIGTPAYLSPEQVGGHPAGTASDVFAWASTVVFAATGRAAFGSDTVGAVLMRIATGHPDLTGVPEPLRSAVARCLDKDPASRPTARDLLLLLVGSADPEPVRNMLAVPRAGHAAPGANASGPRDLSGPVTHPGSGVARSRRGLAVAAVAIVVALAATAYFLWPRSAGNLGGGAVTTTSTSGPAPSSNGSGATPATSASAPQTHSAAPTATASGGPGPGQSIPVGFAGLWKGHITPSNPLTSEYDVAVTLPGGKRQGSWKTSECQGDLLLTKVAATKLTFRLENVPGCVPGTLTLTRNGTALDYLWRDVPGNNILSESGSLTKAA
jgi:serine/threonine protein kinase